MLHTGDINTCNMAFKIDVSQTKLIYSISQFVLIITHSN